MSRRNRFPPRFRAPLEYGSCASLGTGTPSRRALILDAVRSSATPLSATAIATTVGGRKAAVLEEVRALVREGVLVLTEPLIPARSSANIAGRAAHLRRRCLHGNPSRPAIVALRRVSVVPS